MVVLTLNIHLTILLNETIVSLSCLLLLTTAATSAGKSSIKKEIKVLVFFICIASVLMMQKYQINP